ncbi:MAG: Uma2 family endonuclease, partial [Thermoanaerobaculia bacterium]|nr:Uma2 family endonuclease [Thermoanaerobaculia bacterium]
MSSLPKCRGAPYEDLVALPEDVLGQIVDGELHATPRPAIDHQRASSILGVRLGDPFDVGGGDPGGWWIVDEPEIHLGRDVLVPDLAGWRRERLPALPREAFFTLAPDWVCAVPSPSTARLDRLK